MTSDKAYAVEQRLDAIITGATPVIPPGSLQNPNPVSSIGSFGIVNLNPYFAGGNGYGWFPYNCTATVSNSPPAGCPYYYAMEVAVTGAGGHAYESDAPTSVGNPTVMPATGGSQYLITAWVYSNYATMYLGSTWQNPSGTNISDSQNTLTIPVSTWTQVSTIVTAPTAATLQQPHIGTDNGQVIWFAGLLVQPSVPGGLIQTGTLEAIAFSANIVQAGMVDATAIQGCQQISMQDGPVLIYGSGVIVAGLTGSGTWVAPGTVGVQYTAIIWAGAGGGGSGGYSSGAGGGGGGEFATDTVTVTGGNSYNYSVGAGGSGNNPGGNTTFGPDDNALTVTAHGGAGTGSYTGGLGGHGSTNSSHFNGGTGGSSYASGGAGGGGGAGAGGIGASPPVNYGTGGEAGGSGGPGFYQGGAGGHGRASGIGGSAGVAHGGGAGGDGQGVSTNIAGGGGILSVWYTPTVSQQLLHSVAPAAGTDPNPGGASYRGGCTSYNVTFGNFVEAFNGFLTLGGAVGAQALACGGAGSASITAAAHGNNAGLAGYIPVTPAADFTSYTVTGTGYVAFSKAWTIPANDAQVGTTYRLTVVGTNTGDGTNANIQFTGGEANANFTPANGGARSFKAVLEVTVNSIGSGGTANWSTTVINGASTGVGFTQAGALNTASAWTLQAQAAWPSKTGAPTMTCYHSYLERIGT